MHCLLHTKAKSLEKAWNWPAVPEFTHTHTKQSKKPGIDKQCLNSHTHKAKKWKQTNHKNNNFELPHKQQHWWVFYRFSHTLCKASVIHTQAVRSKLWHCAAVCVCGGGWGVGGLEREITWNCWWASYEPAMNLNLLSSWNMHVSKLTIFGAVHTAYFLLWKKEERKVQSAQVNVVWI